MGDRDDVTADGVGLTYVENLARARPEQFFGWKGCQQLECSLHQGHGVSAGIGNPSGEHRDDGARAFPERFGNGADLGQRENGSHIQMKSLARQRADQRSTALAFGICDRYLHIDVLTPACDEPSLACHIDGIV